MRDLRKPSLFRAFLCVVAVLGLFAGSLWAQTTSTEILGLVTDATGAVVPGAKVTITRVSTGETRSAVTNQAGEYTFPLIEIGEYTVRCEMSGFKSQTVTGLRVEIQQKARVNFTLELGQVTESIEVSAHAVALRTEDAAVGQVIDNKRVTELPLNGRNLTQLAVLVAGAQVGFRQGLIPGASVSVIANGKRELTQTVTLDGVDAKEPRTHVTVFTPSIEAIEEFKVQTSSYSAEYGGGGGAWIQVSMKSGTNELHGTVFEFLRNDKLDAESYFLNFESAAGTARLPKDRLRRNQYGAVVSGPVMLPGYDGRNRTFWAFDYEARRETSEAVRTAFFPSQGFRQGDFSALLSPAINPATGRLFRGPIVIFDPLTGDPFPNNIIPQSRLHPGAQNVIKQFLPPPQFQQADTLDFTARGAVPTIIPQNQYFWRVDHLFGPVDRVFARFAASRSRLNVGNINPNFPNYLYSNGTNLATQWLHTFSPNAINELRYGFNINRSDTWNPRSNTNFDIDSLGIGQFRVTNANNRKLEPVETGVPIMGFTIGDTDTGSGAERLDTHQFTDSLSITRNKHSFKTGIEHQYVILDRRTANIPRGQLTFGANESGYDFASFLLGYINRSQTPTGRSISLPGVHRWGAYFLDDWKATARLTVNIGLRWDYFGVPVDRGGYWRTIDFKRTYTAPDGRTVPILYPAATGEKAAVRLWEPQHRFFEPRIGIAYRPKDKWVVRLGGGWFANVEHMNNFAILQSAPPYSGILQFDSVTDAAQTVPVTVNNQIYNVSTRRFRPGSTILSFNDPFGGTAGVRPQNLLSIQPDHKSSDHWQWSMDIQRELPLNTALTVGYVGSKSTHLPNSIGTTGDFNAAAPSPDANVQARRPFPKFYDSVTSTALQDLANLRYLDSYANGSYHGLQVTLTKRYARGLSYGLAYTFSRAMGEGPAGGNEDSGIQSPINDRRGSKGRFFFDQQQQAVVHFVYELPFAKGLRGLPGGVLKGWQVNGIVSFRSGFPFTVTQGSDLNTGAGNIRPDRLADGGLGDQTTRKRWFDTSAFRRVSCNIPSRPDLCHYGSSGVSILEAPGERNVDLSMFKNFAIREKMKLQFRAEFFNAMNTPYFGQPNGITFQTLNSIVPDGPRDGEVRSTRSPMRIIQFALKFSF